MTNNAITTNNDTPIWDQGRYEFTHFGEVYEYIIWADGCASVVFTNSITGDVIDARTRDWGSTSVAQSWVNGVPVGRYGG